MEFKDDDAVVKEVIKIFLKGRKEAEELMNNGIDINITDSNYLRTSVVKLAIKQGKSEVVEFLLDNGAEITESSAMTYACTSGQEDIVLLLLKRFHATDRRQDNEDHQEALEYCLAHFAQKPNTYKFIEEILNYAGNLAEYGNYYHNPLLVACEGGNEDVVRLLLSRGADLYCRDVDGNGNALHWAARSNNSSLVEWLLKKGFNANEEDGSGSTALSEAMSSNNTNVVDILLKNGAKFDFLNHGRYDSPLHFACENGKETLVKLIIEAGADINDKYDFEDYTPLHYATEEGHEHIVNFLVNSGADITILNRSGESLLHLAVKNQNKKLVELFLQCGLKVSAKCEYYGQPETVLELACRHSNLEIINLLLQNATDMGEDLYISALKVAINNLQENVVKLLIESASFYDINLREVRQFEDLIHSASKSGNKNIVQMLLNLGFDINCKDECGHSLIYHALKSKNIDTINLLLNNDANVEGESLQASVECGFKRFTEKLLKQGLNINWRKNENEFSALELSVNNFDLFQTLWNYGGNVYSRGKCNVPLLNFACFSGDVNVVNLLLDKGADTEATDANGINCLLAAVDGGNLELVKMLLDKGMDVKFRDSFGRTALTAALINIKKKYKYNTNDLKHAYRFQDDPEYVKIVEFLLDYGATLEIENQNDCKNFLFTCENKDHSKLKLLLAYNLDINLINEQWAGIKTSKWHETGKIITQYVVKAQSKGAFIIRKIWEDIDKTGYLRAHKIKCEKELNLIKETKIDSTISLYNILMTTDLNQLVEYAFNIDVLKTFSICYKVSSDFRKILPIYYDEMRYQIKRGVWRKFLLNQIVPTEGNNEALSRKISASNRELQAQNGANNANVGIYELSVNYEC